MATDKSAPPGLRLPWAGKQVLPEHVEAELTVLWHLAADNMRISQNMNVRTSVLNFVICAPDVESARNASVLLRDLSSTHIARVILLILDLRSDVPANVSAWTTLRSFSIISDTMRHHFEQITVSVTGAAARSAANIIQPLLKMDLPVYLWWLSDLPHDSVVFQRLIAISSRVIIDSNTFAAPEERIRTLSSLLQVSPDCALSDLNWGRVTTWRELIAQFFDVVEYRPYLINVDQIEIEHAVTPATEQGPGLSNEIRALLLAAWLKTRLGWRLSSNMAHNHLDANTSTYSWYMTSRAPTLTGPLGSIPASDIQSIETQSLTITIHPRVQTALPPGEICLVRMTSTDNAAQFCIDRESEESHAVTSIELPDNTRLARTVNIAAQHKEGDLLHDELEIMGRDHLYERTLHEVFALLA